jgi:hypothetical protein
MDVEKVDLSGKKSQIVSVNAMESFNRDTLSIVMWEDYA